MHVEKRGQLTSLRAASSKGARIYDGAGSSWVWWD
jgi:hypothetical protein